LAEDPTIGGDEWYPQFLRQGHELAIVGRAAGECNQVQDRPRFNLIFASGEKQLGFMREFQRALV
jgi:hypothetical protein